MRSGIVAGLIGLAVVLSVVPGGTTPATSATCTVVTGQGPSCRTAGGWLVGLSDGTQAFTHGGDAVRRPATTPRAEAATVAGQCVDPQTHHHVEIYYANFAGSPDRHASFVAELQAQFLTADTTYLDDQAFQYFGVREHLYVSCEATGKPAIGHVTLSTDAAGSDFTSIINDVRAAGHTSQLAHYWIYTDGHPNTPFGGQSTGKPDDTPGLLNTNNVGPAYSINYGYLLSQGGGYLFAHENAHAMGAVQNSAPHSTWGFHCTDGLDVMCYNDGAGRGNLYTTTACSTVPETFDCGHDDYFNPKPDPLNYLFTHWNTGVWTNLWIMAPIVPSIT